MAELLIILILIKYWWVILLAIAVPAILYGFIKG